MRFYSFSLMSICLAIFVPAISARLISLPVELGGIVVNKPLVKTAVSAEHVLNKPSVKSAELSQNKPPLSTKHGQKTVENEKNKSPENTLENGHQKPAENAAEHLNNKSHEKVVENEKEGPEGLSFAAKKALFTGGVVEKANGKLKAQINIHENAKNGAKENEEEKKLMNWNCAKFDGQNAVKCHRWEKIERELELKIKKEEEIKFKYRTLMPDGQCNFNVKMKTYSKLVLQNLIKNAFNMAKGSNGKDGVKLEEAPLSQEDCMMKLREGWQKLKGELEEQVNFTAAEMKQFGLRNGHEELKDAFPVDKSNLMVELKDKRTNKQMTYLDFEQIAEKVIKHNEEIQLPEKIIKKETKDEWKKVAEDLANYETIIVNNSKRDAHSKQAIMLSYKFNNNEANLYKLLAMSKKITKLIKAKPDLPLILPPTSSGFHGMKKNWQKAANQN